MTDAAELDNLSSNSSEALLLELRALGRRRNQLDIYRMVVANRNVLSLLKHEPKVVAGLLREASERLVDARSRNLPGDEIKRHVELIDQTMELISLPSRTSGAPEFREYLRAYIKACEELISSGFPVEGNQFMERLLSVDLSQTPDIREEALASCARMSLRRDLSPRLTDFVRTFSRRHYLFTDSFNCVCMLSFWLNDLSESGDFTTVSGEWMHLWWSYVAFAVGNCRDDFKLNFIRSVHNKLAVLYSGGFSGSRQERRRAAEAMTLFIIRFDRDKSLMRGLRRKVGRLWPWLMKVFAKRLAQAFERTRSLNLGENGGDAVITRVQGGLGDLMMMRPGLLKLVETGRYRRVVFATNKAYFPAFSSDDPIDLIDIESTQIDVGGFGRWFNFSVCPATVAEVAVLPKIRCNRIEIFANALGVELSSERSAEKCRIRFSPEVVAAADLLVPGKKEKPRVGVQLRSAESYRDYPALLEVARDLSEEFDVFVFDNRPIEKRAKDRFESFDRLPLPQAMACAARMDLLITPDSSFLHLAGFNRVPCLAVFGPTDGAVRTKSYPTVKFVDVRDQLGCIPCWRHENSPCKLGGGYESTCLSVLKRETVVELARQLARKLRASNGASDEVDSGRVETSAPIDVEWSRDAAKG